MTRRTQLHSLVAAVMCVTFSAAALADDVPTFRKGQWEFKRTLVGQGTGGKDVEMASKKCTDPSFDMKAMAAMLTQKGCKAPAVSMKGNVRASSWECTMKDKPVRSETVMTITSDSAYTANITTTTDGKAAKEVMVAKRVGDC